MIIKMPSYEMKIIESKSIIINVGKNINVLDLNSFKELYRLNSLKYPSYVAVSDDEKYFACSDTSGNIEVYDLKTGKLMLKNKGVSCEGGNIYFLKDNVVSISWNGEIFSLDVNKNICNVLLETGLCCYNMHIIKDRILLINHILYRNRTNIYQVKLNDNKATLNLLFESNEYTVYNTSCYFNDRECYFFARKEKYLSRYDYIVKIDFESNKMEKILDIKNMLDRNFMKKISSLNDFVDMIIIENRRQMILAYRKNIFFIDLLENKIINNLEFEDITSINIVRREVLIIATEEDVRVLDLNDLF